MLRGELCMYTAEAMRFICRHVSAINLSLGSLVGRSMAVVRRREPALPSPVDAVTNSP